jgi:hypothetical protein
MSSRRPNHPRAQPPAGRAPRNSDSAGKPTSAGSSQSVPVLGESPKPLPDPGQVQTRLEVKTTPRKSRSPLD